jgi:hypothetical protein
MLKVYNLINFQFLHMLKKSWAIVAALIVFQVISFYIYITRNDYSMARVEQLIQKSGFSTIFLVCFILILGIIVLSIYEGYFSSKSIYTINSLPIKKFYIYLSYLIPGVVILFMLAIAQYISVFISWNIMSSMLKQANNGYMNNALFLTFLRCDYLRPFIPLNLYDILKSLVLIVSPCAAVLFVAFSERSKQYGSIVLFVIWGLCYWNFTSNYNGSWGFVVLLSFIILLTFWFIQRSYLLLKNKFIC